MTAFLVGTVQSAEATRLQVLSRASAELHRVLQDELRLTPKQLLEDQNLALGVFLGEMDWRSALRDALFNWKDGDERLYHY